MVMSSGIRRGKRMVDNDNISGRCLVEYDLPRVSQSGDSDGQRTRNV